MKRKFFNTIEELRRQINNWSASSSNGILLAVSGGIDSMCMAELFSSLEDPLPFAMAHCNFGLRSEESDGDEAMVRRWADDHGIKLHVRKFATKEYARQRGMSIEMAARELRYAWFSELSVEHGYTAVAVAHNANDNAETLILNILRGSGMNGLSGMSAISTLPCPNSPAVLLRPLLTFTRKQIEGYMFAHKFPYREDSTNASSDYKRNRVRNDVFPIFEGMNPSFVRTMNREMAYFGEAAEIVEDFCSSIVPAIVAPAGDAACCIDVPTLMSQKHWKYLLYYILEPYAFNSSTIASLEDLLLSSRTTSGKTFASATHILYVERQKLLVCEASDLGNNNEIMPVRAAGVYHFDGRSIKVEVLPWMADMSVKQASGVLIFDASRLRFPFVLRSWKAGDWLVPLGMKGKKKVSDLFTDLKYDSVSKRSALVLVDVQTPELAEIQHIAAVLGVRSDNRYRVTASTCEIIRISEI